MPRWHVPGAWGSVSNHDEWEPSNSDGQPPDGPAETTDSELVLEALACGPGLVECNGTSTDLATDAANCGTCGILCGLDACINGMCVVPDSMPPSDTPADRTVDVVADAPLIEDCSVQGLTDCGSAFIATFSDPFNCGRCGLICQVGQVCSSGACV